MTASTPVPKDHPLMLAWEAHEATEEYANSRKWAAHDAHLDGSLWALFVAGWQAALASLDAEVAEAVVLVRELDVALNGEAGAAKAPLLIDVLSQVAAHVRKSGMPMFAEVAALTTQLAGTRSALQTVRMRLEVAHRLLDIASGPSGARTAFQKIDEAIKNIDAAMQEKL